MNTEQWKYSFRIRRKLHGQIIMPMTPPVRIRSGMIHSRTNMAILVPEGALKTIGEKNDKKIDAFGYEISAHDTGMPGDEAGTGQEGIMRGEIGKTQSSLMPQSFMVTERSSENDETQRMMSSSV